jgi:hypothetical protein
MDAQRARKHSKAFAGALYPGAAKVSVADGTGGKARGKGLFEAGLSARIGQKGRDLRQKTGFSGDFQRPNLTMRENLGCAFFKRC